MHIPTLTPAQIRILEQVVSGRRDFVGRGVQRTAAALQRLGLVTMEERWAVYQFRYGIFPAVPIEELRTVLGGQR
jgi:hypothetical protein